MKKLSLLLITLFFWTSSSISIAATELKLGTKMPPDSLEGLAFQKFADLVKEKTSGNIIVHLFPMEQLGKDTVQVDNVRMGTQDMYADGEAYYARIEKDFRLASIPFLFEDISAFQDFMTSSEGKRMDKTLAKKNLIVLTPDRSFQRGPYRVMCSTKPITSLEDIKGLKLRTQTSDTYIKAWRHLGANTVTVPWTETYLALRQGMVDAVISPLSLVYSMKFTEVAKYVTEIKEYPQTISIVMNGKKFKSLNKEQQRALIDAAHEAGDYGTKIIHEQADALITKMKDEHGAVFSPIDTAPFRKKMQPFFAKLEEQKFVSEGIMKKIDFQ